MKRQLRVDRCRGGQARLLLLLVSLLGPVCLMGPAGLAEVRGRSTTLLPDGRQLLVGGEGPQGLLREAAVRDPRTGDVVTVPARLAQARAWHTATMLPDGRILIVGGLGADGGILKTAEFFDPETATFHLLPQATPTARAFHTSTLLIDSRVIISGGVSADGSPLAEVDLWDFRTGSFRRLPALLGTARSRHTATLRGDGLVAIEGGVDVDGMPVPAAEVYDPERNAFLPSRLDARANGRPKLEASIPEDRAAGVPLDSIIAFRFSEPIELETINADTVVLSGPDGRPLAAKLVPAEGGMLLFLTPGRPLEPAATYTVSLRGLVGSSDVPLPSTWLGFTAAIEKAQPVTSPVRGISATSPMIASSGMSPQLRPVEVGLPKRYDPAPPTYQPPTPGPRESNCNNMENDPVDCGTGLFVHTKTDLYLPDVIPLSLTRTYRTIDGVPRPFGIGTTHPYELFIWLPNYPDTSWADLYLADGARIHYDRISPGTTWENTVMEHVSTPGIFYKSRLETTNGYYWYVKLKNGAQYTFSMDNRWPPILMSIRDRNGNQVTITRVTTDPARQGDIKRITSPNGRYIEFSYDSQHQVLEARDNTGRVVKYEYDVNRRLTKVTDAAGGVTEYTYGDYSVNYQMLSIKDARGIVYLTNEYDANRRVSRQTMVDGGVWTYAYALDNNGNVKQTDVTDPRGTVIRKTFNADGYTLTNTLISGRDQQKVTIDRQSGTNLVTRVTDPLGRKTDYTYDGCGNVTSVTRLAGTQQAVTTTFTYQTGATCIATYNRLTSITDPLNHTTTFGYDAKGNPTSITDPLNHQTTLSYNAAGQPTSITDSLQKTWQLAYEYGDLTSITDPLQRTTTRVTDYGGRLASLTNALGQATFYEYDTLNRLTKLTDPLVGLTEFAYDPNGNLLSVKDARGGVTSYAYNSMDRLQTRTDPLLKAESYQYDLNGSLTRFTDRKQEATNFTYDAFGRLTQASYGDGSSTTYSYDPGNRLTQVVDSQSGTITLSYDNLDRLTQEVTPQGTVSYNYDTAGRRTSMTVAGQPVVNYTYDNADRLTQITQGTSAVTFGYDAADRRTSLTLPNGIVVEYKYDAAGQLTNIDYKQGSTLIGDLTYTYDASGNRVSIGGSFGRTGLPQPLASAVYDAANRLRQWGATTLTHDDNGNMTSDGANAYTWDARNRLASMTGASFQYDAFGRRVGKTVAGSTAQFLYDGVTAVQQVSGSAANLLTGLGADEIFTRTDAGGTRTFLTDALGSVAALLDSAGVVRTQYTYEPFGKTSVSGLVDANPMQYAGRENEGTGLYYFRARYYAPALQRFISEDPIGFAGADANLYAYAFNRPSTLSDPSGLAVDAVADLAFITYDVWRLFTGGRKDLNENTTALLADGVGLFIPGVTGLGAATRATGRAVMHHTIPREILKKYLPQDVATAPLVRGCARRPNRWPIPYELHKAIHKGAGGGRYNDAFKKALAELKDATVEAVLQIRDEIAKRFGLWQYRP